MGCAVTGVGGWLALKGGGRPRRLSEEDDPDDEDDEEDDESSLFLLLTGPFPCPVTETVVAFLLVK